jgi:hypothetical protein
LGRRLSETERYLQRVADGLDVVGPAETEEILTELRSHIVEAIVEADGDETKALAAFDGPTLLATRILQERGVLPEGPSFPEAPALIRVGAVVVDAARWLVILWLLLAAALAIGVSAGPSGPVKAIAWTYTAVILVATTWWWVHTRRQRGKVTAGMKVFGLRRVQLGDSVRLVRNRDVPGERRSRLEFAGSTVWGVFLVLMVAVFGLGIVRQTRNSIKLDRQQAVDEAVSDARDVMALMTSVYDAAIQGNTPQNGPFSVAAAGAERELLQRYASGAVDHYSISTSCPTFMPRRFRRATSRSTPSPLSLMYGS